MNHSHGGVKAAPGCRRAAEPVQGVRRSQSVSRGADLIASVQETGALTPSASVTAAGVRVIVVMITVAVLRVAGMSVGEMTVEEMSAVIVVTTGVETSAVVISEEEMIGAATEIAGRTSQVAARGGELLKLAPRLCRGYLLQLLNRSSESLVNVSIRLMMSMQRAKKMVTAWWVVNLSYVRRRGY